MAITIVATVGASNANSFVTEAEFIAYLASRLNVHTGATVTGSTCSETEKAALLEATRDLTAQPWRGYRVTTTQVLNWPREYAPVPPLDTTADALLGETGVVEYATDEIPQRVKDATMELALQYCKAGTTDLAMPSATEGVVRKRIDVIETEYAAGGRPSRGLNRYPRVQALIAPLLTAQAGGLTVVRV